MKNLKNLFFFLAFLASQILFSISPSVSHAGTEVTVPQKGATTEQTGFLFEIEKNGFKSFVFGTIHTGFSPAQLMDARTTQIIKKSRRIYVEADISDVAKSDKAIEDEGFYKGDKKLAQSIDAKNYDLYRSILVDRGQFLSIQEYEIARPWLIAMLIPIADSLVESYPLLKFGSDIKIIKLSKEYVIPLIEIEGIANQAQFFSSMADDVERVYFSSYVDLVKNKIIYGRIFKEISAWTSSDFESLENLMVDARQKKDAYSSFYFKNVIDERNKKFIKMIANASNNASGGFFAVGCEHLAGVSGVVHGLRDRGYSVKQIKY
ncbi:TraB/GumN family protein [Janthinobacterium sp. PC23-8]|uniref:TraB/GumN family protein n=1 Tax=Janthinobacterium sp. PC23-8 TaxID=2012679 RepID=UPI001595E71E|nr:TraB/GumN family protein [Janthinobacterium sp. PC23-8]